MAPLLRRTWSPRGQTPVLRHRTRHHQKVSMVVALCVTPNRDRLHLYFRLHPAANIRNQEVIAFLRQLLRHVHGHVVLLWDRLKAHRAVETHRFLSRAPRIHPVFFPPYAPELNPPEQFWSYLKTNPLANAAFSDLPSLTLATRRYSRGIQRADHLLRAFVKHCPLPLRLK